MNLSAAEQEELLKIFTDNLSYQLSNNKNFSPHNFEEFRSDFCNLYSINKFTFHPQFSNDSINYNKKSLIERYSDYIDKKLREFHDKNPK